MALYPAAVKRLIPPGPNDPPIKARVVILHVAQSEAASLHDYFNGPSGGVESHFYIRRDGTVEQYRDTDRQADANVMANDFAISVETQGMAAGEWTTQQLAAIKALLTWCNKVHSIPLVKCPTWDGSGVGYHILFEAQWDQRGAACPGPDRIKQFNNVLVPWMAASTAPKKEWDEMATKDEIQQAVTDAIKAYQVTDPTTGKWTSLVDWFRYGLARRADVGYARDQLVAAVKAGQQAGPSADAAAIADELGKRLNNKGA